MSVIDSVLWRIFKSFKCSTISILKLKRVHADGWKRREVRDDGKFRIKNNLDELSNQEKFHLKVERLVNSLVATSQYCQTPRLLHELS